MIGERGRWDASLTPRVNLVRVWVGQFFNRSTSDLERCQLQTAKPP